MVKRERNRMQMYIVWPKFSPIQAKFGNWRIFKDNAIVFTMTRAYDWFRREGFPNQKLQQ